MSKVQFITEMVDNLKYGDNMLSCICASLHVNVKTRVMMSACFGKSNINCNLTVNYDAQA